MSISLTELQQQVRSQKEKIPSLYGAVDFDHTPLRFTADPNVKSQMPRRLAKRFRGPLLADQERVERARAYTMLGDIVADAYAALMPRYGFRPLIDMLKTACDQGLAAVPDAPPELHDFIGAMENTPHWLDLDLVDEGARISRNQMANLTPFAIRGAFIATFMNQYSGLPMALTGTLSGESAVQRVNETASFFTTATLPGALRRYGVGFKAAAMVRLMHSMVRFNLLTRSEKWDVKVYGIPIPQVDQMPAGTIPAFLAAFNAIGRKRKTFTPQERAIVELCRYQSFLLGLPEALLPATPQAIVDVMMAYSGTLRDGYDDATCGALVRATMGAYRPRDKSIKSRIFNEVEKGFAKVFFNRVLLSEGNRSLARKMQVAASPLDYLFFAMVSAYVLPQVIATRVAQRIPVVDNIVDQVLINKINRLLVEYGHPEYTTDASKYQDKQAG
ncbi:MULTISPECIES: oxygenase MpaB family protein [unclassified Ketobacter]|uniref:oxygenase MpaB family protein n=1 Tax=unclassified Ketobacter TaxID=2639109 RepID=UPI000F25BCF5|nr:MULTISPECIES: oxygenase MpaB family protein [unclassified Ketobacter]RLT89351.1 MAG: DUF2236 domain-containing protein [Ketobacter sp. GenoA1]RLT95803.1 MAG: DUF2236 domain-containing protein [Ketobacter sp.]